MDKSSNETQRGDIARDGGVIDHLRRRTRALTEGECAAIRECSTKTLQRERTGGSGPPYIKYGPSVRYLPEDLADWLEQQRRRAPESGSDETDRAKGHRHE